MSAVLFSSITLTCWKTFGFFAENDFTIIEQRDNKIITVIFSVSWGFITLQTN